MSVAMVTLLWFICKVLDIHVYLNVPLTLQERWVKAVPLPL